VGSLDGNTMDHNPLQWLEDKFSAYLEDRRANPRDDILTGLATAKYPEGDTPEIIDVVKSATFLFAAGQETTTKLLSAAMRVLAENPAVVERLRNDRTRIPNFVEEMLRMESPVKSAFRLAKKDTVLAGVEIPAGTILMINPGAINRDPRRFECPHEFDIDRHNVREHLAFSRGAHSCPGGPLARVEGRVSIERILDRMTNIALDPEFHGPDRDQFNYEPTFILRGLTEIHITFDAIDNPVEH
jgi:cytochrome P450